MPSREVQEAQKALLDPFTEPEPFDETGPNAHFRSTFSAPSPAPSVQSRQGHASHRSNGSRSSKNPFRHSPNSSRDSKASSIVQTSEYGNVTPQQTGRSSVVQTSEYGNVTPQQTGPARSVQPSAYVPGNSRREDTDGTAHVQHGRRSSEGPIPYHQGQKFSDDPILYHNGQQSPEGKIPVHSRARSTSLQGRFAGDRSHEPLAMLRKHSTRAHRSPHLRKKHQPGADAIDRLDIASLGIYHHEGPYDAASRARNSHSSSSPLAITRRQNEEALRATPKEAIYDSVHRHRPLDGVAIVPPGTPDRFGRKYEYEEGPNLMLEGGYKRWPGIEYKDDDIKGKGEPSYTVEKALKDHKSRGKNAHENEGFELKPRRRTRSVEEPTYGTSTSSSQDVRRRGSASKQTEGLRARIDTLRNKRS